MQAPSAKLVAVGLSSSAGQTMLKQRRKRVLEKPGLQKRKSTLSRVCFALVASLFLENVHAEGTCPPGYYPTDDGSKGVINCAPVSGGGDVTPRGPKWERTWGAVAIDSSTGDIGAVVGQRSKSRAKQEAMKRCAISGSKNCAFRLAYRNQCVVVAWPNGVGGHVLTQSAPSIEVATSLALPKCETASNMECRIAYAECTDPVLVY